MANRIEKINNQIDRLKLVEEFKKDKLKILLVWNKDYDEIK